MLTYFNALPSHVANPFNMLDIKKALSFFFPLEKFINSEASTALNQTWGIRSIRSKTCNLLV